MVRASPEMSYGPFKSSSGGSWTSRPMPWPGEGWLWVPHSVCRNGASECVGVERFVLPALEDGCRCKCCAHDLWDQG